MNRRGRLFSAAIYLTAILARPVCGGAPSAPAGEAVFVYDSGGRRDPFVPPRRAGGVAVRIALEEVVLEGIAWDADEPLAVINEEVVFEGQQVAGFVVRSIQPDKIVLQRGDETHIIELQIEEALVDEVIR